MRSALDGYGNGRRDRQGSREGLGKRWEGGPDFNIAYTLQVAGSLLPSHRRPQPYIAFLWPCSSGSGRGQQPSNEGANRLRSLSVDQFDGRGTDHGHIGLTSEQGHIRTVADAETDGKR